MPSGLWRVQIRRRSTQLSRTFRLKSDAARWAAEQEARIDRGETVSKRLVSSGRTLGDLIESHMADMAEVGKAAQRSKEAVLLRLQRDVGRVATTDITREMIIDFGRRRAKEGAGPVTLSIDLTYISTVLQHAAVIYGQAVPTEQLRLGRAALLRLGLVGSSMERDRRPTEDELTRLLAYFRYRDRQVIPMERVIQFAIATAMRQEEITRILCEDFRPEGPSILIRQRKHPRDKKTNDQLVPLVSDAGFDAAALLEQQFTRVPMAGRVFPYNPRSIGAAFRRACGELQIDDLHFHDLRHEAISRLFEADWDIPQVASVSGHKDWKMLQRYTHLTPAYISSRSGRLLLK